MAKVIDIVVPDLGDFDNVEVIEVLVGAGDTVERPVELIDLHSRGRAVKFRGIDVCLLRHRRCLAHRRNYQCALHCRSHRSSEFYLAGTRVEHTIDRPW